MQKTAHNLISKLGGARFHDKVLHTRYSTPSSIVEMKLIVAGGTGLLASEVIRQSLQVPEITSVVALARKPITVDGLDSSKLKNIVIEDYGEYPPVVQAEFAGADACIWTVAITPGRSMGQDFAEVKRVCQDYTMAGLKAMYEAGPSKPFRFVYLSGEGTPRDMTKKPLILGQYLLMRGATENMVLEYCAKHADIEICVAKPGIITSSITATRAAIAAFYGFTNMFTGSLLNISRADCAAALLHQVVHGFEKETLFNADLIRIGRAAKATP